MAGLDKATKAQESARATNNQAPADEDHEC